MPVVADKCPSSIQLFISFGVHEGGAHLTFRECSCRSCTHFPETSINQ
jgi:hypothetical protein